MTPVSRDEIQRVAQQQARSAGRVVRMTWPIFRSSSC